jgi:capsular exopolysaccharide synthesis family protein
MDREQASTFFSPQMMAMIELMDDCDVHRKPNSQSTAICPVALNETLPVAESLTVAGPQRAVGVVSAPTWEPPKRASASTLDAMSILRALRRRQTLALAIAFLGVAISAPAAWYLVPSSKFTARARLQLAAQPPKVLFRTIETESSGEDYRRYQNTQLALVRSQLVLSACLSDKKIRDFQTIRTKLDPIGWLQDTLKVEFVGASEVMEISLSGDHPEELADLINAIKKAYMEQVVNVDAKRRSDRHAKLKEIKDRYGEQLKDRRDRLKRSAEAVGSDDRQTLALRQQFAWEHVASLRKELLDIQSRKRRAEVAIKTKPESPEPREPSIDEAEIDEWLGQNPVIAEIEAQVRTDNSRLNAYANRLRLLSRITEDSYLKRLRETVKRTEEVLKKKRSELRSMARRQLEHRRKTEQVAETPSDIEDVTMLTELEERLDAEIKSVSEANRSLNVKTLDLSALQDETAQLQTTAGQVAAELEALTVELQAPPRVRSIEDAVPPKSRDRKKRFAMIGLITLGSFFGGLFSVALLESRTQKVGSVDEVPAELGLQIVGTLPTNRTRTFRITLGRRTKNPYWDNAFLESIDATRTMLIHAARTASRRVVMIASADSGEGKTSLSCHLATSLARGGLRTLLVDADLRNPSIHRRFDLTPTCGLSELLRGEAAVSQAIVETDSENLKVVTAGVCDQSAIRLLTQGDLGSLFSQFKDQFDFVIVDSSPILPVADASMIAQQADAVVFSIFSDVSRKTNVCAALHRLQCLGVTILGAVVTDSSKTEHVYGRQAYFHPIPDSVDDPTSDSIS